MGTALNARFADDPRVRVRELLAPIAEDGGHSAVVAINILEHIADDVAALQAFSRLLTRGEHVILLVSAFSFALSRLDRETGTFAATVAMGSPPRLRLRTST